MVICNTDSNIPLLFNFLTITISFSIIIIPLASALFFNYSSFSDQSNDGIAYEGDAFTNRSLLIGLSREPGAAGRATYSKPLPLWDKATGNLTDFTTHFSFVIDSQNNPEFADGLAFFLAPQRSKFPNDSAGGSLGLTKLKESLNSSIPFVAVEFDIFVNSWDPPFVHVGIDVNSMESKKNVTWWHNITGGRKNEAWISYNSTTHNLSVSFTGFRDNSSVKRQLDYKIDLRLQFPESEFVTFGFAMAAGTQCATFSIYTWEFSSSLSMEDITNPVSSGGNPLSNGTNPVSNGGRRRRKNRTTLAVGLSLGGGVLVAGLVLIIWRAGIGRKIKEDDDDEEDNNQGFNKYIEDEFERGAGPKKFSYKQLAQATNDFNDENKLGQGGFGGVYKGFLRETNSYIAVKRVSKGSKQGIKEYASEIKIISRLRHRNLVQLLGWCHEQKELLLVYEFMPNGSLDSHLFKESSLLTWDFRFKIAQGLASGLLYLQEEWEQCVVHRDIKSSNIMLDSNFNAKIGDFGLARLVEHTKGSQTTVLAGTMGYMAPECATTGKASKESDVYSFGIVALETACGRSPINPKAKQGQVSLLQWVWDLYGNGKLLEAVDQRLSGDFDEQQVERLMIVGLWCAHPDEILRPSIRQAIQVLNFEALLPALPPKMPVPMYFSLPVNMLNIYGTDSEGGRNQSSHSYNTNTLQSTSSSVGSSSAALLNTR